MYSSKQSSLMQPYAYKFTSASAYNACICQILAYEQITYNCYHAECATRSDIIGAMYNQGFGLEVEGESLKA